MNEEGPVTDETTEQPEPEVSPEAVTRATALLARATVDPTAVAAENAQLRSAVRGSHGLLHALVKRWTAEGDPVIVVPREEWQAHDPREELQVVAQDDGSVHLWVRVKNRAERRAER